MTTPASPPKQWRTLDEVKAEVLRRAGGRLSPFENIKLDDAAGIVGTLKTLDRDEWAAAWSKLGHAYEAKADALAANDAPNKELAELYELAFDATRMGRYPAPSTPGKKQAYRHSLRMFRKAANYFDVPLQVIEIPFKDKKLVGYLQVPPGVKNPPIVLHWGGVDGWKEDRQRQSAAFHKLGIASLTIDMPGTGECPVLYSDPDAQATYTAWIDHIAGRTDVDGQRLAIWGGSFGGYWAARMAYVEPIRLKGAVFHGGNAHLGFQKEWLVPAFTTGGATYLFGAGSLLEARGLAMGTKTLEEFIAIAPKFSLEALGLIDQPSAPILGINGKLDDQAPAADIHYLMEHGSPKSARIYPNGHHMGRTPGMPEMEITNTIAGWLAGRLAA
jgi:esterase FrsA